MQVCQYSVSYVPGTDLRILGAVYVNPLTGDVVNFDLSAFPGCFSDVCIVEQLATAFPPENGTSWISEISTGFFWGAQIGERLQSFTLDTGGGAFTAQAITGTCVDTSTGSTVSETFTAQDLAAQAELATLGGTVVLLLAFGFGLIRRVNRT